MKTILYLGNRLSKHGFSPTVIETLGPLLEQKYRVLYASDRRNVVMRFIDMMASILRYRHTTNVVLIDTYSTSSFYYAWWTGLLSRFLGLPYVPILHGGNLPARLEKSRLLSRTYFGRSLRNVAPSRYLESAFAVCGYRTAVIPNFLTIQDYPFTSRSRFHPRLLWVRSLHTTYHPEMAVKVIAQLQRIYPSACLCMVGPDKDGSLDSCRRVATDNKVSSSIEFTGRLPRQEWHHLSRQYDVFINTTNVDNTPVSVIESMALGLPIVSTNVGGLPYLIENGVNGILIPPGDVEAMVDGVCRIVESPEYGRTLALNARTRVEQFDAKIVLEQWVELLDGHFER